MSNLGLLQWKSDADLEAQERQQQEEAARAARIEQERVETALSAHIRKAWESARDAKNEVEQRMLSCLRRVKGEYEPDKLRAIQSQGGSEIYMMLTATKCRALEAWVRDVLIPHSDKPWGLEPTPIAEVPPQIMQQIQMQVMQEVMQQGQGQQVDPEAMQQLLAERVEEIKEYAQEKAVKAAENMERQIEDNLAEAKWIEALEAFIGDFSVFPAAIMKGPVLRQRKVLAWQEGWQAVETVEIKPEFERVSPFDFYPSPDATTIDDAGFVIERIRYRRADLQALIGIDESYDEEAIREVLRDYGQGGLRDWLWGDSERSRLEGKATEYLHHSETIDALHYWGSAQGLSLLSWGVNPEMVPDPLLDYEIEAILVGKHLIKVAINDDVLQRRPYGKASFAPIPGSFWGTCIPELMADIQDMCNSTARTLVNNLAIASGPQVEVSMDRIMPGENVTNMYPWKVWKTKSSVSTTGTNNKAVSFFQPNSNSAELLNVYSEFERRADDATNIPRYIYGNERVGGAGNTASGLSMLMESANKGIKAAIGHIDAGVIRPMIEALWLHNMLYTDDPSIKGDVCVVPRGSSAMLQRDSIQVMRQQMYMQLVSPEIAQQALGVRGQVNLLRDVLNGAGLTGLVPEGVEDKLEEAQSQPNPQAELMMAEMQAKVAKMEAEAQRIAAAAEAEQAKAGKAPAEIDKITAETLKLVAEIKQMAEVMQNERIRTRAAALVGSGQTGAIQHSGMAGRGGSAQQIQGGSPAMSDGGQLSGGYSQGAGAATAAGQLF